MKFKIFLLLSLGAFCTVSAQGQKPFLFDQGKKIYTNNRILAKVNGTPISVVDIMKKMDMLFYRQYPQYADNVEARHQFYQVNWKAAFQEMIDKELVLADAKESKMEISQGDVRQEMEKIFGPNIIKNLDTAGLSYEDASKMVEDDLYLRRMLMGKVNALAVRKVTPQQVKEAYHEFVKNSSEPDEWVYQVISIRGDNEAVCSEIADRAYEMVVQNESELDELSGHFSDIEGATIKLSKEFKHTQKDISDSYRSILISLQAGHFSEPVSQKSRADNSMVYRIFFLKELIIGGVPPLHEIEHTLRDKLIDIAIAKDTDLYITKLRRHYHVNEEHLKEMVPDDFQPFTLR